MGEKYGFNVEKHVIEKDGDFFCYLDVMDVHKIIYELNDLEKRIEELKQEKENWKMELKSIFDVATANKVRDIVEKVYDDLLYETSEESNFKREIILECLEKIDVFRDDLE